MAVPHFLADGFGWSYHVRSALRRTPVQDFNSFSIMYYIISTTYKKIGDLFCPVHIPGLSHSVDRKLSSQFDKISYMIYQRDAEKSPKPKV